MGIFITAKLLDQIGLVLGFVSGVLFIPEIFNLIPLAKLEKSIEKQLGMLENWATFPLKFSPPSWKYKFADEDRMEIERITAVRSLIFSIVWITILLMGILFSSKLLIFLCFLILITVVIGNIRKHFPSFYLVSGTQKILVFFSSLFLLVLITPLISLIRVVMLILRAVIAKVNNYYSTHEVLRSSLTLFAILAFIISNIFQFIATLL